MDAHIDLRTASIVEELPWLISVAVEGRAVSVLNTDSGRIAVELDPVSALDFDSAIVDASETRSSAHRHETTYIWISGPHLRWKHDCCREKGET